MNRTVLPATLALLVPFTSVMLLLSACDKSSKSDKPVAASAEAANAAVPPALGKALSFKVVEQRKMKRRPVGLYAVIPADWEEEEFFMDTFSSPEGSPFSGSMRVGSTCGGRCEPKDYAPIAEEAHFDKYLKQDPFEEERAKFFWTIDRDEPLKGGGHVLHATRGYGERVIVYAWWRPKAEKYFFCEVELSKDLVGAFDAFDIACRSMVPVW